MTVQDEVDAYIRAQPEPKRSEMRELHETVLKLLPGCRLWFLDGRDESGRTVSNPNIGYGAQTTKYADGTTRDFYQIGMSANTTGISIYLMGLNDKKYLTEKFGAKIGKASVTGYCIKFRRLKDVNLEILVNAIRYAIEQARA